MRLALALICLTVLGACGVDGPPVRPLANVGISISPDGISTSTSIGVRTGPVRVSVGK